MDLAVVMVNYNNSRYLRRALDSVIGQSVPPAELVVADDCSTDASCAIVEEYRSVHPWIRLVKNPVNLGPSGNRDAGIRACRASHFVTLDSDDWLKEGALAAVHGALSKPPHWKIVVSDFEVARDESHVLFTINTGEFCQLDNRAQLFALAARKRCIPGNQLATAVDVYKQLGGLNTRLRLYEDWEFVLRATIAGVKWVHSGVTAQTYRKDGSGISSTSGKWRHARNLARVAAASCIASRCNWSLVAGFVDLVFRKGSKRLLGRWAAEGFN